ncbi:probable WRKY transcription factor 2 [Dendrobium catenatum]|uniref:Putative WRKY transcription factor 2 n=1 Tax=Dendrobium catenatum TaxID=906689 RepID=A0A2I0W457_9ASPA|nr:probable WRKY transcription factor 2 [Dendrobium catenatum]XP_020687518.1 probable WRKY transcription factor 2 [Dendrobium catenatum]PKU70434.1 putative WRKY transcription factor 2 [Dendrobium catenatum]
MAGMDDDVSAFDDWLPSSISPKTLFSDDSSQKTNDGSLSEPRKPGVVVNDSNQDCATGIQVSEEYSTELNTYNVPKSSTRGALSKRIAGRAGFGNLTLDTSQIRKTSFDSPSTNDRSPLITIPPGLSPTMLLDSPNLVSNSLIEPFRSTDKMDCMVCDNIGAAINGDNIDHATEDIDPPLPSFKLPLLPFSCAESTPELSIHPQQPNPQDGFSTLSKEKGSTDTLNSNLNSNHVPILDDPQEGDDGPKGEFTSAFLVAPTKDGYNWRKYGQKQVKGSEFPRSYYKCTYPNCEVKKKVELSQDGHATEIIYKGTHNHLKSSIPLSHSGNDLQIDELDPNQYASVPIEQCEQSSPYAETPDGADASSFLSNDDEDEQETHGSASPDRDSDGDETESKRRKLDACALEMNAASRAVREARVVVQTTSEIDILDDGYRWRKYGQKVVKGNPNPRSYYKCTNPGCKVRKHVERAAYDVKSVITTYEGKHSHVVPTARTSNQASSSTASIITTAASPSSCLLQKKAEAARMADCLGRFDTPAPLGPFGLPSRDQQLGPAVPNFSYARALQGFNPNVAMAGLGNQTFKMSVLPPLPAYMSQNHPGTVGYVVQTIMAKEEPAVNSRPPVPGNLSVYHSLSRRPMGP